MSPTFLLPASTVHESGAGPALALAREESFLLVTLGIEHVIEQQSLRLAVYGSADGSAWNQEPLVEFPQKFYTGLSSVLVNLRKQPQIRFVRVQWQVDRWGRGDKTPSFRLYVVAEPCELPAVTAG